MKQPTAFPPFVEGRYLLHAPPATDKIKNAPHYWWAEQDTDGQPRADQDINTLRDSLTEVREETDRQLSEGRARLRLTPLGPNFDPEKGEQLSDRYPGSLLHPHLDMAPPVTINGKPYPRLQGFIYRGAERTDRKPTYTVSIFTSGQTNAAVKVLIEAYLVGFLSLDLDAVFADYFAQLRAWRASEYAEDIGKLRVDLDEMMDRATEEQVASRDALPQFVTFPAADYVETSMPGVWSRLPF